MHTHGYWAWLRDQAAADISRRDFLSLLGASVALAGAGACMRAPDGEIVPYTKRPRIDAQGRPLTYATTLTLGGYGIGLLVDSYAGRPTKVEGNPVHPASLGATGPMEQASVLQLYDPARNREPRLAGKQATWEAVAKELATPRRDGGAGLRVVMERTSSPLLAELLARLLSAWPHARVTFYVPGSDNTGEASHRAHGRALTALYDLRLADVIACVDADVLTSGPFALRYAHDFAERRRLRDPSGTSNRLYAVETALTPTGTMADHRLALAPRDLSAWLGALVAELVTGQGLRPAGMPAEVVAALGPLHERAGAHRDFVRAVARDLARARGASAVLVGDEQPAAAHVLTEVANLALGNMGRTVRAIESPVVALGPAEQDLASLAGELRAGTVDTLVVLETDLAYSAPGDLGFQDLIERVPRGIYLGLYDDETAALCKSVVPAAHYLEAWGDARALDGTVSLVQPLIAPLYGGWTSSEVLAALAGERVASAHDLLQSSWRRRQSERGFDELWAQALQSGVVDGSAAKPVQSPIAWSAVLDAAREIAAPRTEETLGLSLRLDARLYDGRFANNAWLLELPEPITHQSWGNAALVGPQTARALGVEQGQYVELEVSGRRVQAPALVVPGQAEGAIVCQLGFGHRGAAGLGRGVGFNASVLRGTKPATAVTVRRLETREQLAVVQPFRERHDRPIALATTLADYRRQPELAAASSPPEASFYEVVPEAVEQWAMTIDLSLCTGCSACVVACQAENNIPVVGKQQVRKNRWMHWLRVDEYLTLAGGRPVTVRQPMLCQHCEMAPCEYVCPVNATVHSPDGLNEMVYNRCVGTRYCSNNCPYKVRRFNWFDWYEQIDANRGAVELQRNPNVTVRERGVMEKCTYCVQRLREKGIEARIQGRRLQDGEVKTACQQACPTGAILFGSLTAPSSAVARSRVEPRCYGELADQGTRPRTRYLAKVTNPNPEVA